MFMLLGIATTLPGTTGCDSVEPATTSVDQAHLKVLGILYGKFLSKNRGQAPLNRKQFVEYLNSKRLSWEKLANDAEQFLTSPFDGKPLIVLYGKSYHQVNRQGTFWMAYENEGVDGSHRVINIRGDVEKMDPQQIKQLFPEQG